MSSQKVLMTHDSDIDDPRIMYAAMTAKKAGYEVHFAGVDTENALPNTSEVFKSFNYMTFGYYSWVAKETNNIALVKIWSGLRKLGARADSYAYPWYHYHYYAKKQLKEIIDKVRPDIIHAHNIISAHYCIDAGVPVIMDDHEYSSLHARALYEGEAIRTLRQRFGYPMAEKRWIEWEKDVGKKCKAVITVAEPTTDYWKTITSSPCYTIPNYPLKDEMHADPNNTAVGSKDMWTVYMGNDDPKKPRSQRNISGLYEVFEDHTAGKLLRIGIKSPNNNYIRSVGYIDMELARQLMREKGHIGIVPWHKHWLHHYIQPNKTGEYTHSGMHLIVTKWMTQLINDYKGYCDIIENYNELKELLRYYNKNREDLDKKRSAIYHHAKENLTWEKHEDKLLKAYNQA